MKNFKSKIAALALATAILVPGVSVFANVVGTPSGGTWDYGVGGGQVWSNYQQYSLTHKSTAVGSSTYTSGWKSAGVKSYASAPSNFLGGNEAFYDEY